MEFTEEDFKRLLFTIAKQQEQFELFYKGWQDFTNINLKPNKNNQTFSNLLLNNQGAENMKNITKRKDNRYMIRKTINGERITKYARTKLEAKQILKNLSKNYVAIEKKETKVDYTLKEYSEIWLNLYKKGFIAPKSFSAIKGFVTRITNCLGNIKLKELTTYQIQEYLNTLPKSRAKEKICIYFNSILQKAFDTNLINNNPFKAVVKDKKIIFKNNSYTYIEQQKILQAIKNTDIEHEIMIYLMTGCRPNELPKNEDFDFKNNLINIYGTKNSNALHRQIEMSKEFMQYIQPYLTIKQIQAEKYVSRKFIKICNNIGISKPLLYRLRHTFATNHFTLGTQPKIVQQWLGHSKISITLDTYTDIDRTASKNKIIELYNNFYYIKK